MSRDAREIAYALVEEWDADKAIWDGLTWEASLEALKIRIAAAIERDRAETIERCAKVAGVAADKWHGRNMDRAYGASEARERIRALLPSPPQEGQP